MKELYKSYELHSKTTTEDGLGGYVESWAWEKDIEGVIDMLNPSSGTSSTAQKIIKDASHILLCQKDNDIKEGKRIIDGDKVFKIVHADNPLDIDHHMEVYVEYDEE